jgi:hypothetical protein
MSDLSTHNLKPLAYLQIPSLQQELIFKCLQLSIEVLIIAFMIIKRLSGYSLNKWYETLQIAQYLPCSTLARIEAGSEPITF